MATRLAHAVILLFVAANLAVLVVFEQRYGGAPIGLWRGFVFYGGPAVLALVGLASFRAPKTARHSLAVCILAALAALYGSEIYLGSPRSKGINATAEYAALAGITVDPRTMAEAVDDLRNEGKAAMPAFYPRTLIRLPAASDGSTLYPLSNHANRLIVHCNEEGPWRFYTTDEQGFNNPPGLWDGAPIDLALIGDSFAWGVCVPRVDSIADRLRERAPRTVTLGMSADGPLAELATLREYLPALRPRTVLWLFYENDLTDLEAERTNPLLMAYLDPKFSQNLYGRRPEIEAFLDSYMADRLAQIAAEDARQSEDKAEPRSLKGILTFARLRLMLAGIMGRTSFDWPLYRSVLENARNTVAGWDGELVFVYLATPNQLLGVPDLTNYRQAIKKKLFSIAGDLGIAVIDTEPGLTAIDDPHRLAHFPGGHFSSEGYAVVAREILAALETAGRLPPR
jgi:hypothetical protein